MLVIGITNKFGCCEGEGGRLGKSFQRSGFNFDEKKEEELT